MKVMSPESARKLARQYRGWGTNEDYATSLVLGMACGLKNEELATEGLTSTNREAVLTGIQEALKSSPLTNG